MSSSIRQGAHIFINGNPEILTRLIDPSHVKTRTQSGQSLSYIEGHRAIRTANEAFGIGGWGYTVEELTHLATEPHTNRNGKQGFRTGYRAVVKVRVVDGTEFSDVGFGDAVDYSGSQISVHELAMKEAVTDGIKRALKNFGDVFGLGLYDAERRADVDRRRGLTTDAGIKREVFRIAKERLDVEKPTAKQVAEVFGRKATDLNEPAVLRQILVDEGVL